MSWSLAILVLACVAVAKELYDKLNKANHAPDAMDAVFTILGSLPIMLLQGLK